MSDLSGLQIIADTYEGQDGVRASHHVAALPDQATVCLEHLLGECSECGGFAQDHPVQIEVGGRIFTLCSDWVHHECGCDLPRYEP